MATGGISLHGRLLSFLDLLAITVAAIVILLSIVPDKPFTGKPTDWYSFTVELQSGSLTDISGSDLTPRLLIGFLMTIKDKQYDILKHGDVERQFHCNSTGLEMACYFRGEKGEKLSGTVFIRDDAFFLRKDSAINAAVFPVKMDLSIKDKIIFERNNHFSKKFTGVLQ